MPVYEYKVLPAPTRGRKVPGVKTPEARFALGVEDFLNDMARAGWDYLRTDILPSEERQGFTSTHTVYRSVAVFRREITTPRTAPDVNLRAEPLLRPRSQTDPTETP